MTSKELDLNVDYTTETAPPQHVYIRRNKRKQPAENYRESSNLNQQTAANAAGQSSDVTDQVTAPGNQGQNPLHTWCFMNNDGSICIKRTLTTTEKQQFRSWLLDQLRETRTLWQRIEAQGQEMISKSNTIAGHSDQKMLGTSIRDKSQAAKRPRLTKKGPVDSSRYSTKISNHLTPEKVSQAADHNQDHLTKQHQDQTVRQQDLQGLRADHEHRNTAVIRPNIPQNHQYNYSSTTKNPETPLLEDGPDSDRRSAGILRNHSDSTQIVPPLRDMATKTFDGLELEQDNSLLGNLHDRDTEIQTSAPYNLSKNLNPDMHTSRGPDITFTKPEYEDKRISNDKDATSGRSVTDSPSSSKSYSSSSDSSDSSSSDSETSSDDTTSSSNKRSGVDDGKDAIVVDKNATDSKMNSGRSNSSKSRSGSSDSNSSGSNSSSSSSSETDSDGSNSE